MPRMNVPPAHLGSLDSVPHLTAPSYSNGNYTWSNDQDGPNMGQGGEIDTIAI